MRNETKFLLATIWIKFGLVAMGLPALFLGIVGLGHVKLEQHSKTYDTWINGMYTGQHTVTETKGEATLIIGIVLLVILASILVVVATRKNLIDFEGHYAPLREGSRRRKVTFALSVLLGWLGIDRLAMGCILRGALKFFFGFSVFMIIGEMITGKVTGSPLAAYLVLLTPLVYWWSVDVILIGMGVAKKRRGVYLT